MTLNAGLTLDSVDAKTAELVKSGIRAPRVRRLPPGMKLYRFACADNAPTHWPAGPWWVGQKTFHRIVQEAIRQDSQFGMGWAARHALAIRQQWSKVNALVEAVVAEEIYVFAGTGKNQYREPAPNGMLVTWAAWPNVEQMFLPHISDRFGLTDLGRRALTVYRSAPITSYQLF